MLEGEATHDKVSEDKPGNKYGTAATADSSLLPQYSIICMPIVQGSTKLIHNCYKADLF